MKRSTMITIVVIVVVLLGGYIIWAATRPAPENPGSLTATNTDTSLGGGDFINAPATTTGSTTTAPIATPQSQTFRVDIKNFAFAPADLQIKIGDTVRWENFDSVRHSVSSTFSGLNSELLAVGETFEYKFTGAGVYNYDCGPHPRMKASVTVR